jgi:hypothetical protein
MAFSMKALATDLAKANPHMPSRTLAKKMKAELGNAKTLEQCRSAIRKARGNCGEAHRKYTTAKKPNGKAGMKLVMPKSIEESWTPLEVTDAGTWGIIGDLHVPYHSETAVEAALNCIDVGDVFASACCLRWCKTSADCGVLETCEFLATPVYVGATQYGVCYDGNGGC